MAPSAEPQASPRVGGHCDPHPLRPKLPAGLASPGKPIPARPAAHAELDIVDIRRAAVETSLRQAILDQFCPDEGPRTMPTLLLYDEKGLQLFEKITYLEEYYLTNNEINLLRKHAADFARQIPPGAMLIELGSGNLRKVNLLLQALECAGKAVDYYALDLSRAELQRTLSQLPPHYRHVRCHGLLGTYEDGRAWLQTPAVQHRPKCVLTLGSSLGNFPRADAAAFLRSFADVLQPGDAVLVGLDGCADPGRVYRAYNDKEGLTHRFVLNGLAHANRLLHPSKDTFRVADWRVVGEYVYDAEGGRHQAFYAPRRETVVLGQRIAPHEHVLIEQSFKYAPHEARRLWRAAGLAETGRWEDSSKEHALYFLTKPKMPFSLDPAVYGQSILPTVAEWESVWTAWDTVTRRMLPDDELLEKPIRLRNACIFYLGHIPTFLDIQLNKTLAASVLGHAVPAAVAATLTAPTEPAAYADIFERGIDPDVDNPALCHAHSTIPDEWPPLDAILAYQRRVRARVRALYAALPVPVPATSHAPMPRAVAQALWVGFEHELMHLETLLYMMLQSDRTLPPPADVAGPASADAIDPADPAASFERLAAVARRARVPNQWFDVPAQDVQIGLDDPEGATDPTRHFGWDNEKPARRVHVHAFQTKGRPITNEEYAQYMYSNRVSTLPASWVAKSTSNGTNGHENGHANGLTGTNGVNGHASGHVNGRNGYRNGYAKGANGTNGTNGHNGTPNGFPNGCSNGHSNGHTPASDLPAAFLADKAVRTVYGPVPLAHALDWPVFASFDELAACAAWLGGRLPTFEEARSLYQHADGAAAAEGSPFLPLHGANVGFQHWHPVAVSAAGGQLAGQAGLGGVWEWTSTPLRAHAGFAPMALYPNYTADFFDGKHNIVLGGSWATHPRIAGRKSFVNWYQRNYPYAWVGARLVRDL